MKSVHFKSWTSATDSTTTFIFNPVLFQSFVGALQTGGLQTVQVQSKSGPVMFI